MAENESEALAVKLKKQMAQKMSGLLNLGQKRRRSVTPMRPVAIAPKTNFQNVELRRQNIALKNEPGFITILPTGNNQIHFTEGGNKSVQKIEQFEIINSLNSGLHNAKRIKLANDDAGPTTSYIILQNQNLDNSNTIHIGDNCDNSLDQSKTDPLDQSIKKNITPTCGIVNQYNVVDKTSLDNFNTYSRSSKTNFGQKEQIAVIPKSEKLDTSPIVQKSNFSNGCELIISKNAAISIFQNPKSLNNTASNFDSFENLSSAKTKSQKPVVIMQQLLSLPNKTSSGKTEPTSIQSLNKLLPLNIQGANIEPKRTSPPKTNESYYDSRTMSQNEQDTDFLLKKDFPVISSSQVDSVLKAIDMQVLNKGSLSNEVKKQVIHSPLTSVQGADKLEKSEDTHCANTITGSPTKLETIRLGQQFQTADSAANYSKPVQQLVDTLQCYKCKECPYMSLNEKHVMEHIERKHINVSEMKEKAILKCMGCSNTFHFEASLLSHIVHDHEVHESEAQIMVQQLFLPHNISADNNSPKSMPQIGITRTDNLLLDNQQTEGLTSLPLSRIKTNDTVETTSQFEPKNNRTVEDNGLQYMQNITNISVTLENNLEVVDVRTIPFFNDEDKAFPKQVQTQENQQGKLFEIKNANCSENLTFIELKNPSERSFEFINLENKTHNKNGQGYLQEEDITGDTISDAEMELSNFTATESNPGIHSLGNKTVKMRKKGRPKGSKIGSAKTQLISLKKGYQCGMEDCGVRMLVQENITYHQRCHAVTTASKNPIFQCPECMDFKTNNWNNLAGHLWRSHIIDMELHSCDLCSYKTPSLSNLTNQHRGIHGADRPFLCDNCGKGFKTRKQLRNHRDLHRAKAKEPLKCDECGRDFTNTRLLKLHKDIVHKDSKPFTCNSCPYSASTRSALKLHLRRHTGEKPFVCDQCSYSTGDHNSLRRHKQRHLGLKPYSCPHCSYACIQSSTYKVHLKNKHPGLDHDLMFSCQYCTYKSIKKENLLTHMAKHEQVPYKYPAGSGTQILVD